MNADAQLAGKRISQSGAHASQMIRDQVQALARAESIAIAPLPEIGDGSDQLGAQLGADIR